MLKEVNKIIDLAIEFSRDNLEMVMIGGVSLLVLVIIISTVKSSKDDDEEDYDFDEAKYKREASERSEGLKKEVQKEEEQKADAQAVAETDSEIPEEDSIQLRGPGCLENILGELASFSAEGIKELNIKIQGAEVKITYSKHEDEAIDETVVETGFEEDQNKERKTQGNEQESEGPVEEPAHEQVLHTENTISETKGQTYKKFNIENNNVSKSGRIYTEEELEDQIRD